MNYYRRHIGDYIRGTLGLSMLEDGAYNRLLDQQYITEKPLPLDRRELYRMTRCRCSADRKAVDYVLGKFFLETAGGFVKGRVFEEIEKVNAKAQANRQNGKKGGRPAGKSESTRNPDGLISEPNENLTQDSTTPLPKRKDNAPAALSPSDLEADGLTPELAAEYLAHRKRKKALLTPTAWAGVKVQAEKANLTPAQAVAKCLERGWTGFDAAWLTASQYHKTNPLKVPAYTDADYALPLD